MMIDQKGNKTSQKSHERKRKEPTPSQEQTKKKNNLNHCPKHLILLFVGHGFFQEKKMATRGGFKPPTNTVETCRSVQAELTGRKN